MLKARQYFLYFWLIVFSGSAMVYADSETQAEPTCEEAVELLRLQTLADDGIFIACPLTHTQQASKGLISTLSQAVYDLFYITGNGVELINHGKHFKTIYTDYLKKSRSIFSMSPGKTALFLIGWNTYESGKHISHIHHHTAETDFSIYETTVDMISTFIELWLEGPGAYAALSSVVASKGQTLFTVPDDGSSRPAVELALFALIVINGLEVIWTQPDNFFYRSATTISQDTLWLLDSTGYYVKAATDSIPWHWLSAHPSWLNFKYPIKQGLDELSTQVLPTKAQGTQLILPNHNVMQGGLLPL